MTKINLDLSLRQVNLLFESLETLKSYYKTTNTPKIEMEINDLIRHIDKLTFGE